MKNRINLNRVSKKCQSSEKIAHTTTNFFDKKQFFDLNLTKTNFRPLTDLGCGQKTIFNNKWEINTKKTRFGATKSQQTLTPNLKLINNLKNVDQVLKS